MRLDGWTWGSLKASQDTWGYHSHRERGVWVHWDGMACMILHGLSTRERGSCCTYLNDGLDVDWLPGITVAGCRYRRMIGSHLVGNAGRAYLDYTTYLCSEITSSMA